jgi:hypothetical protein
MKSGKVITLHLEIKMIKISDEGVSQVEIGQGLGFPRTTVITQCD